MNSEEGRRQLVKIKELHLLADRLGCTAAQLAIGNKMSRVKVLQSGIRKITMKNIFYLSSALSQSRRQKIETEVEKQLKAIFQHLVLVRLSLIFNL